MAQFSEISDDDVSSSEDEEDSSKNRFDLYKPQKHYGGTDHPTPVCESASLSYVKSPKFTANIKMSKKTLGNLSSLQLETIGLAYQKMTEILPNGQRAGFLIGDGTGVGKGRMLAGIICALWNDGFQKALWVSASPLLFSPAQADLQSLGFEGRLILTKSSYEEIKFKQGVLYATYSSLYQTSDDKSRYTQITSWLGEGFNGVIIFDESHRAKKFSPDNPGSTIIGEKVVQLQNQFPDSRIVYASATGAWEAAHMAYFCRLGLWGNDVFQTSTEFIAAMVTRPVEAIELLAMELKREGFMVARQLSYDGVTYETLQIDLTETFKEMYKDSCLIWVKMYKYLKTYCNGKKRTSGMFWSEHQRFFSALCVCSKMDKVIERVKESIAPTNPNVQAMQVVIGLQTTGETAYRREHLNKGNDFPKEYFLAFSLPLSILRVCIQNVLKINISPSSAGHKKIRRKTTRQKKAFHIVSLLETFVHKMPRNPLDQLVNSLGGPEKVAEMTGRKNREIDIFNQGVFSQYRCISRSENSSHNDFHDFIAGKKPVVVISDAASTGVSLHSDTKISQNPSKRLHITVELAWSADRAIQQMGRTHRSNQKYPPHYLLVFSPVPAEWRFSSTISQRLQSMGALTHGDRKAIETSACSSLSEYNINRVYGKLATKNILKALSGSAESVLDSFTTVAGQKLKKKLVNKMLGVGLLNRHFAKSKVDKITEQEGSREIISPNTKCYEVEKFLNRLFGLELEWQDLVIEQLKSTIEFYVKRDRKINNGKLPDGVRDATPVQLEGGTPALVTVVRKWKFHLNTAIITLHHVEIDRGLSWENVLKMGNDAGAGNYKFYQFHTKGIALGLRHGNTNEMRVYRPGNGIEDGLTSISYMKTQAKSLKPSEAEQLWIREYDQMKTAKCYHEFTKEECPKDKCKFGARTENVFILSGGLNKFWAEIHSATDERRNNLVRCVLSNGKKVIGLEILEPFVYSVIGALDQDEERNDSESDSSEEDDSEDETVDCNDHVSSVSSNNNDSDNTDDIDTDD